MSGFRWPAVGFVVVAFSLSWACSPGQPRAPIDPDAVAVFNGGEITVRDLDEAILELPPAQRLVKDEKRRQRDRQLIKVLTVNRLILDRAETKDLLLSADFQSVHDENRQRVVAEDFVRRHVDQSASVTESDVRDYYEEHQGDFSQSARRMTSHIFRRVTDEVDVDEATDEMVSLRERALSGESFADLARDYSDSETGAKGGGLGWLEEDKVPPDLAGVIFSLDPGVPSRPVVTAEGVHIFVVTAASAARTYTIDEVGNRIANILMNQKRKDLVVDLVEELEKPDPYFVADREDMEFLLGAGDPEAEIFQIGQTSLSVARFREILDNAVSAQGAGSTLELPWNLVEALVQRTRIFEHCRAEGFLEEQELKQRLETVFRDDSLNYLRERALTEEVNLDTAALEAYFDAHRSRFSSPLTLDLRLLIVPIPDRDANSLMVRLSRLPLDTADDRLQATASEVDGRVEKFENATLPQIRRWSEKVGRITSGMGVGECTQPVRVGQSVVVVEVTRRVEPEPSAFAAVTPQVARAYLDDHRHDVYVAWSDRLLDDAGFEVVDGRLEEFWAGGDGPAPSLVSDLVNEDG